GEFFRRRINSPGLIFIRPVAHVRRAFDERDFALQVAEIELRIRAGEHDLTGDAARRRLPRIRNVRRRRHHRAVDAETPPLRVPSRERVALMADVETDLLALRREKLDELGVRVVAGVFRTELRHPELLIPDFFFRRQQIGSKRRLRSRRRGDGPRGHGRGPLQETSARKRHRSSEEAYTITSSSSCFVSGRARRLAATPASALRRALPLSPPTG